ncbi:MAG: PIN domain-containing protein [Gammaproteobacteria bacterium]
MNDKKPIALIDTDVASYLLKGTSIGWEYLSLLHGYQIAVSFITAGELLFGALRRDVGPRRHLHLNLFLVEYPIIPFQAGMERLYSRVLVDRERMGKRLEKADGWIATTALYHRVPLATHDGDFVGTRGLRLITASEEARAAQLRLPVVSGRPLKLDMSCRCGL